MAKTAGTLRIDFSKEEEGGGAGRIRLPEGDYHVKILSAKSIRSANKDTPGLEVTFLVIEGKKKGKKITDTLYITPKSLKRVRLLLEAVGVKVPKSAVNIPLAKLKGKTLWIELEDEERDGYDARSRVTFEGFMDEDTYEEDEDDEDEEDEDEEDEDDDEEDDEDEDEDEDDEDEEDEDEDEEEEEAPVVRKKRRAKRTPAKKAPAKRTATKKRRSKSLDEDEIEDLDLDTL